MNNPNPLLPQGSFLEQHKSKGKSNLIIAVFTILAIHVVLFGGLLMQGCSKHEDKNKEAALPPADTNLPPVDTNTLAPIASNVPPVAAPLSNAAVVPPPIVTPPVPEPAASAKEYTVAKGDSFYSIAKANGVSVSAITKANPGIDSRHLKVGQKLQIPAGAESAAAHTAANEAAPGETASVTYTVKPGDTLARIAKHHGTSVKAIKAASGLKGDRINVGQKLKLPAPKAAAPAETSPASVPATPVVPVNTNLAPAPRV
ncbi:MAG: LysM peptidoglycan-binding domain-containing protein [Limisphaerales bacterium]